MTFLACLGALWIVLTLGFAVKYVFVDLRNRESARMDARQKALDEAVTRAAPVVTTTEAIAPPGAYELAMQEHLRFANEVNEWNRLVTTTPPVRFQPVNFPETRQ